MIFPIAQPDWFRAPYAQIAPIVQAPGLRLAKHGSSVELHRSHLPLMDDPEARRLLAQSREPDWDARNRALADRGVKPRNAQHAAVDFITQRRGTLLGDEMRVGKTLSAILSHDPASGPLVIVCPAMVRAVWLGWLERVFPGESIGVLMGRTFKREALEHRIIVVHYEILAWWQSARKIGTLVFDEAHRLTNAKARWSKAAVFLSGRAERVIAATGTPIWNLPKGLWSVLTCLAPGAFGGYDDFARRYCAPEPTAYGTKYMGISNETELQARLSEVMIRRRWIDVQQDLPAITRNVALADLSAPVMRKLDVIAAKIASDKATTIGHLASYRRELSHFKASMVVEEAKRMLDRGEPVVIWTWHTDLAETIHGLLAERAYLVTGEINTKHRAVAIEAWNQTPAAALVCTMAVAQVGLDFSHAHLAIFAEIDYTPAILAQAEMRTYSPTRSMNITYVVANHMIEQRIVAALMKKLAASNPLGVAAADDTITMLRGALYGEPEQPDLDRLLADILDEM